jgi:fermentation-respiration switch protein FrsA (DUF1100 family)
MSERNERERMSKTHTSRRWPQIVGGAAVTTLLGGLAVGNYVVEQLTRPQPDDPMAQFTFTPWELQIPCEDLAFPTRGGAHDVRGWWLPQPDSDRVVIACGGYRGNKADMLGISSRLWQAGNNVLLFDYYGHGAQTGVPVTLAFRETLDFLGAVDYAATRLPQARIGVIGFSMGAAIAIMGAARDARVRVVVADSPFATHRDVVAANFRRRVPALPADPFLRIADILLGRRAGYHFREVEPLSEVQRIAPRPLLIIHSTGDAVIPYHESERLYAAAGTPKELWIVDDVPHCGAYFLDRDAYCRRVTKFFAYSFARMPAKPGAGVEAAHAVD